MRLNIKVSELTPLQWQRLQELVQTEYVFRPGMTRACVVFTGPAEQERHIEMPFSAYWAVNSALELMAVAESMPRPEDLPQDARLVEAHASQFDGAPPIRKYSDGSTVYGPYADPDA